MRSGRVPAEGGEGGGDDFDGGGGGGGVLSKRMLRQAAGLSSAQTVLGTVLAAESRRPHVSVGGDEGGVTAAVAVAFEVAVASGLLRRSSICRQRWRVELSSSGSVVQADPSSSESSSFFEVRRRFDDDDDRDRWRASSPGMMVMVVGLAGRVTITMYLSALEQNQNNLWKID